MKPGQVSKPHYEAPDFFGIWPVFPADITECKVIDMDKKQLYKEAQHTAPSYRRYSGCSCCSDWLRCATARERAAVKAEAFDWNKREERCDFAGQISPDHRNYDELAWLDAYGTLKDEWYCRDREESAVLGRSQQPVAGDTWTTDTELRVVYDL